MKILVVLFIMLSGCARYNNIWTEKTIFELDRSCLNSCKVEHYKCVAYNQTRSTAPCDRVEEYCAKNCVLTTTVTVPDYDKMKLLKKCGPPPGGVDESIFWKWCRRGLIN